MTYGRRLTATAFAGLILLAACGSSAPNPSASASGSPSTSKSVTPSTSTSGPIAPAYKLMPGSQVDIEAEGSAWPAIAGTMSVSQAGGGTTELVVNARAAQGGVPWKLTLAVGSAGRALSGTVTGDGQTWQVLPATGLISSVVTPDSAEFTSLRAITVNLGTQATNVPMVITLKGSS